FISINKHGDAARLSSSDSPLLSLTKPADIKNFLQSKMFDVHRRATIHVRSQDEIERDEDLDSTIIHILQPSSMFESRNSATEQPVESSTRQRKNRNASTAAIQSSSEDGEKSRF
ncbi:unnamed protein product, partial [Rotaria socialis]